VAFVGAATGDHIVNSGSSIAETPPAHSEGDLLVAVVCYGDSGNNNTTISGVAGYSTLVTPFENTEDASHSLHLGAFYKIAGASEGDATASTTAGIGSSDVLSIGLVAFSSTTGWDSGLLVDGPSNFEGDVTGNIDVNALTVTTAEALIAIGCTAASWASVTEPSWADATAYSRVTLAGLDLGHTMAYDLTPATVTADEFALTTETNSGVFPESSTIFSLIGVSTAAPTITSALTCGTRDADGMNCGVTVDEDSTGHMVACRVNSTAPTDAQVKAGDCTGDEAALEYETASLTATVSWDAHFTGLASRPAYDIYFIATNAGGDSAQGANVDEERGCASAFSGDCDIFPLTSLAMAGWAALSNTTVFGDDEDETFWGTTTEIAANDWVEIATVGSIIGCEFTHTTTGDFTVAGIGGVGDCPEAKESIRFGIMSATTGNLFASAGATYPGSYEGQFDFLYLNNSPPICPEGDNHPFQTGEAYERDFALEVSDPDGDGIDLAVTDGAVINGLAHSGTGDLLYSGTVDDMDEDETGSEITRRFDDGTGDHCFVADVEWPIDTSTMPNFVGVEYEGARSTAEGPPHFLFVDEDNLLGRCDRAHDDGDVLAHTPGATTEVEIGDEVDMTVMQQGICLLLRRRAESARPRRRRRQRTIRRAA